MSAGKTGLGIRFCSMFFAVWFASTACLAYGRDKEQRIVVSAAASMTDLINDAVEEFSAASGIEVGVEYGSSGSLARKVEAGAPIDVYVSANSKWIDYVEQQNLLEQGSRVMFARNTLVFCEPVSIPSGIAKPRSLTDVSLLSIGDPGHVPAGQYARQALEYFDLWNQLMDARKLVLATDVRGVLTHLQVGEVTGGIVYSTDAMASSRVRIVFTFPEESHDPITYYAGVVAASSSTGAAREFMTFLQGERFRGLLRKYGFTQP